MEENVQFFFRPVYSGSRFEDATLPAELMEDFVAYEDLLIQVAKHLFKEQNNKSRVPKGFTKDVSLKLARIDEGSFKAGFILVGALACTMANGDRVDFEQYYTQARDVIDNTVHAAQQDLDVTTVLPASVLGKFKYIGRKLKDGEAISFSSRADRQSFLTPASRRRLLFSSPEFSEVEGPAKVRGIITGHEKDDNRFTIKLKNDVKIFTHADDESLDMFMEAYDSYNGEKRVLVSGTAVFERNNVITKFKQVDSITYLHALDVPTRLEEFLSLSPGWADGEGQAFAFRDIKWLSDSFDQYFDTTTMLPLTYAGIDNAVTFEWRNEEHDASLELDLSSKSGYYHYLNHSTDSYIDQDIDLSTPIGWQTLQNLIKEYFKAER